MIEIDLTPIKPMKLLRRVMLNESGYYGNNRYAIPFIKRHVVCYDSKADNKRNETPVCISELVLNNRIMEDTLPSLLYRDNEYNFSIYENKKYVTSVYESDFGKEFIYMSILILNSIYIYIKQTQFNNKPMTYGIPRIVTYRIPRTIESLYFYIVLNKNIEKFLYSNKDNILNSYKTFTGKTSSYNYTFFIQCVMSYLKNIDWFSDFIKFEYTKNIQELNFKSLEIPEIHYDMQNDSFYIENMSLHRISSKTSHHIDNFLKDNLNKKSNSISIDINKIILGDNFEIYIDENNSKNLLSYLNLNDYINLIKCNSKLKGKRRCKRIIKNILNESILFKKCKFRIFTKKNLNGKKYYTCIINCK